MGRPGETIDLGRERGAQAQGRADDKAASAPLAQPPKTQTIPYFTTPLENDDSRVVAMKTVILPPGTDNRWHRHPGDQWTAIQEGEITFTIQGQEPVVLKAGDHNYVPRGTVHRQQNLSDRPVRLIELSIFDKDKPRSEKL